VLERTAFRLAVGETLRNVVAVRVLPALAADWVVVESHMDRVRNERTAGQPTCPPSRSEAGHARDRRAEPIRDDAMAAPNSSPRRRGTRDKKRDCMSRPESG